MQRAEEWRWGSLWRRLQTPSSELPEILSPWPVSRPRDWVERVNGAQTAAELEAIRMSVERSRPFGGEAWVKRTAADMGLESTLRRRGRPSKGPTEKGS